jgi:hypothetical protein
MQNFELPLPESGSILFIGAEQQMASIAARQIIGRTLLAGGSVKMLVADDYSGDADMAQVRDWLNGQGENTKSLDRLSVLHRFRDYRDPEALVSAIERKGFADHKPLLIVRDGASDMSPLLPGASWLNLAEQLALTMSCRVLTTGHYGPAAMPAPPDLLKYNSDQAWLCQAGLNLSLTMREQKPGNAVVHFNGVALPYGAIGFENNEEVPHDFA